MVYRRMWSQMSFVDYLYVLLIVLCRRSVWSVNSYFGSKFFLMEVVKNFFSSSIFLFLYPIGFLLIPDSYTYSRWSFSNEWRLWLVKFWSIKFLIILVLIFRCQEDFINRCIFLLFLYKKKFYHPWDNGW